MHQWKLQYRGEVSGRPFDLFIHPDGRFKLETVKQTAIGHDVSVEIGGDTLLSFIQSGTGIVIEAANINELKRMLLEADFSLSDQCEITRHHIE
jgi:hypothetical protein